MHLFIQRKRKFSYHTNCGVLSIIELNDKAADLSLIAEERLALELCKPKNGKPCTIAKYCQTESTPLDFEAAITIITQPNVLKNLVAKSRVDEKKPVTIIFPGSTVTLSSAADQKLVSFLEYTVGSNDICIGCVPMEHKKRVYNTFRLVYR